MVLSEASSFLRIAAADLATARASTDPTIFREAAWGFWLQQPVEKALKAWLLNFGVVPATTHDLSRLLLLLKGATGEVTWSYGAGFRSCGSPAADPLASGRSRRPRARVCAQG